MQPKDEQITAFSIKLDALSQILGLYSCDDQQHLQGKVKPVSHKSICPVHIISPVAMECETVTCNSQALHQMTPI